MIVYVPWMLNGKRNDLFYIFLIGGRAFSPSIGKNFLVRSSDDESVCLQGSKCPLQEIQGKTFKLKCAGFKILLQEMITGSAFMRVRNFPGFLVSQPLWLQTLSQMCLPFVLCFLVCDSISDLSRSLGPSWSCWRICLLRPWRWGQGVSAGAPQPCARKHLCFNKGSHWF